MYYSHLRCMVMVYTRFVFLCATVLLLQREKFIEREWRGRERSSETPEGTLRRRTTTKHAGRGIIIATITILIILITLKCRHKAWLLYLLLLASSTQWQQQYSGSSQTPTCSELWTHPQRQCHCSEWILLDRSKPWLLLGRYSGLL